MADAQFTAACLMADIWPGPLFADGSPEVQPRGITKQCSGVYSQHKCR